MRRMRTPITSKRDGGKTQRGHDAAVELNLCRGANSQWRQLSCPSTTANGPLQTLRFASTFVR